MRPTPDEETKSLHTLRELDRLERPAWTHESAKLQSEILEKLEELKAGGVLSSAMQLHTWLQDLAKAAFKLLELPVQAEAGLVRRGIPVSELYEAVRRDYVMKK